MRLIALALFAAASLPAAAGTVDLNLSDKTIEGKLYANAGLADWTFGALYNRDQKDSVVNVGLLAVGDSYIGNSRVKGGIGGKVYSVSVEDSNVLALGLGGQFTVFPADGAFGVGAYGFYAPRVVTALDGLGNGDDHAPVLERAARVAAFQLEVERGAAGLLLEAHGADERRITLAEGDHGCGAGQRQEVAVATEDARAAHRGVTL